MNIFLNLKELFNKNIDCGEDMSNHIVFFLKKKKYIYINKNIIVRDGTACVVVYKNKVRDVILPGKFKITEQVFPNTFNKAKVDKKNKKGKTVKKIRVDLYYVNMNEIKNFDFNSTDHFVIKSKELGRIKGYSQGACTLRVLDPALIVKDLLFHSKSRTLKTKKIFDSVSKIIGNGVNKRIQKEKVTIDMIFNNQDRINLMLNTELEDAFDGVGLFVKNVKLKAIKFPKKSLNKINNYLINYKKLYNQSPISNAGWKVGNNENPKIPQMSRVNQSNNMSQYKICNRCGFKNNTNAIKCRNCNMNF